jgi:hypothetical protein
MEIWKNLQEENRNAIYAIGLILEPLDQGRNNSDIVCMRLNDVIQILNIINRNRRQMIRTKMRS